MRWLWAVVAVGFLGGLARAEEAAFLGRDRDTWAKELRAETAAGRRSAAFALGQLGRGAVLAVSDLVDCLNNPLEEPEVLDMAAFALGDILPHVASAEAVWREVQPRLVELAKTSKDAEVR